ncbi:MAG: hypothetical protein HRU11_07765 [Parvularculaceae bacterium]|nr:hypothetical protein [Parvularculaceae bacterium]
MTEEKNHGPIQTLSNGAVKVKIWEQQGENGSFPTVSISKTYRDRQTGELRDGQSFTATDVLKLEKLMPKAYEEIERWTEYFKGQQQPIPQQQQPVQEAAQPTLLEQRDLVMNNAAPLQETPQPVRSHER